MRVGIIGGTFDPIHYGHLLIAEEARVRLCLEEVLFIPTGQPWMKADETLSPSHHRLSMVRLGVESNSFFRAVSTEIDRSGPTYTLETLEELREDAGSGDQYYFIMGTDSLKEFHRWKGPEKILALCTLVAAQRPGFLGEDCVPIDALRPPVSTSEVNQQEKSQAPQTHQEIGLGVVGDNVAVLEGPAVSISGTDIRRRGDLGLSTRYQVPDKVEDYIYRFGLYRGSGVGV